MTELPAPAPPESPGAKKASRESCATPISPDSDNSSEKVDARAPGSPAESERPSLPVVAPDEGGSSDATPSSPVAPNELEAWLVENVEAERRAAVRGAADSDDERPRPPPRSPGPLPKDSTCCICLDPVLRRRDAIIFECEHFVCKSCSSDLARHTAEAGAVSTRRGVSVTCPLCRRRAKLEISN